MVTRKKRKTTKDDEDSGLTKNQLVIIVAIIAAAGTFFGGSAYDSMWQERAIIEISFGGIEGHSLVELQFDGNNYYIDILAINRGSSQTDPLVVITTEDAKVSFDKQNWLTKQQSSLLIRPGEEFTNYRFYVQPDGQNSFSISLFKPNISLPHEVFLINPSNLVFQFNNGNYTLSQYY